MADRPTDHRIDRIAKPQHGVIALRQARAHGVSGGQVRARLGRESLVAVQRGVYRTVGAPASWHRLARSAVHVHPPAAAKTCDQ